MKFANLLLLFLCCAVYLNAAPKKKKKQLPDPRKHWVDSVYNELSYEERIGQLFMVAAYSSTKNYNEEQVTRLIDSQKIGGVIFMQGNAVKQATLTNNYQHRSKVPLLVSMDAEWGLGMRLDSVRNFPRQMLLGATHDTSIVYKIGAAIAAQCKRLGVHIDFAPVVDVNNNPANPVINSRSFGEDKNWVTRLAIAFMRGLQDNGVAACAKHFPGHGDTDADSHLELPHISKTLEQLDTLELYPFRRLIAAGVKSVMVGHLEIPALDTTAHLPTTLSYNAVTGLLREKLGFHGVVFTDALAMQGVAKYYPAGEADMRAFAAGNDVLLFAQDVPKAISMIRNAIDSGRIPASALEASVRRILNMKYNAGLTRFTDIDTFGLLNDLNKDITPLREAAARSAVTLVSDDNQILRKINDNSNLAYIGVNADKSTPLLNGLKQKYPAVKTQWLPKGSTAKQYKTALDNAGLYDAVIVGVHGINYTPANNYGLTEEVLNLLQQAATRPNVMIALMGNAYSMQYLCGAPSLLVAYDGDSITETVAAQVLVKMLKAKGTLPVTSCIGGKSTLPDQKAKPVIKETVVAPRQVALTKTIFPIDAGVVEPEALNRLSVFINRCVVDGVFPGCRILAAHDGKIFFDRAFGNMSYTDQTPVDTNTLYDLASCTKVLATTLAVMKLYDEGKISLDKTLGDYLPITRGTDKAGLVIRDVLLHQAGLKSWIPFYKATIESVKTKKALYHKKYSAEYSIEVCEDMFMRKDYLDTIWSRILTSPLENTGKSVYSDLDFIFLGAVVEQVTGKRIDKYVDETFYKPLGLKHLLYMPVNTIEKYNIAPTELDQPFRERVVRGYVHDPAAAMMGGVAGHAGLFGTANDVAVVMQMLLNKGGYKGKQYIKPETVELFTAFQSKLNHRGLGFDKPATTPDDGGPCGARCSARTYGHQGFTGTCMWADPATGIVFIFLSNRVNPTADNGKINKQSVRQLAQDYVYEALGIPMNHTREELYKEQVK